MQPLLSLVAEFQAAGETGPERLWIADAAARVLLLLLKTINCRQLTLGDADALRLLSAAPLVLRVQPQMLHAFAESARNHGLTAEALPEPADPGLMLEVSVQAVGELLAAVTSVTGPEPCLPARAVAAARATSLRPQALCSWLVGCGGVINIIAVFLPIVGEAPRRSLGLGWALGACANWQTCNCVPFVALPAPAAPAPSAAAGPRRRLRDCAEHAV